MCVSLYAILGIGTTVRVSGTVGQSRCSRVTSIADLRVFPGGDILMPGAQCTVHRDGCACDIAGHVTSQEQCQPGAFLRFPQAAGGTILCKEGHGLLRCITEYAGLGVPGADGVYCDAIGCVIQSGSFCHADNTVFLGGVNDLTPAHDPDGAGRSIDKKNPSGSSAAK